MIDIERLNWNKTDGLMPAIIQNAKTGQVLMLGYMTREALQESLLRGKVVFYSRSRQALWLKGETSDHYLHLNEIRHDCDLDALLVSAEPKGHTCHKGEASCFGAVSLPHDILQKIEDTIERRKLVADENSYICKLHESGLHRIAQKVGEEAVEVVITALVEGDKEFLEEMADLLFHMLVLLSTKGYSLKDVLAILEQRATSRLCLYGSITTP